MVVRRPRRLDRWIFIISSSRVVVGLMLGLESSCVVRAILVVLRVLGEFLWSPRCFEMRELMTVDGCFVDEALLEGSAVGCGWYAEGRVFDGDDDGFWGRWA